MDQEQQEMQELQEHHHHHHGGHHSGHHSNRHSSHHRHHHHGSGHSLLGSTKAVKLTKGQRAFRTVTTVLSIAVLCAIFILAGKEIGASIYEWIQY